MAWWMALAGLAAAYVAAAQVGLTVILGSGTVSPVWPPTGLGIAVLGLWGWSLWPAVAIGAFAVSFFMIGTPLPAAASVALGSTLEAVVGAWILRFLAVRGEVARGRDAMTILAAAAFAPIASATIGAAGLALGGATSWAILHLLPRETALVAALASGLAVLFTLAGAGGEPLKSLQWLQMSQVSLGGGTLLLTGAMAERTQVEQALRMSRKRLSLAFKAGRSGIFQWNAETGACQWSDELLTLYGLTSFGGRYKDWLACVVPEDQVIAKEAGQRVIEKGEVELIFRIRRADDGEVHWMHGRARLLRDAAG